MHRLSLPQRGFTVIELLVVFAVIGVLIAIMLPAIGGARETARRLSCRNNLRQIGIALHNYHAVHNAFPPASVAAHGRGIAGCDSDELPVEDNPAQCTEYASWTVMCLPMLDQSSLAGRYNHERPWSDLVNRPVVSSVVDVFRCRSSPAHDRLDEYHVVGAMPSDYGAVAEVSSGIFTEAFGVPDPGVHARLGAMAEHQANPSQLISDGLSNTIMIAERAGRPATLVDGQAMTAVQFAALGGDDIVERSGQYVPDDGIGWADPDAVVEVEGVTVDGTRRYGPRVINAINADDAYSFHAGGAQFLLSDGSVRFLSDTIDAWLYTSLCTRSGQEVIGNF